MTPKASVRRPGPAMEQLADDTPPLCSGRQARVVLHDYCGHPFTVALAYELGRRGYSVAYVEFGDFTTPKGSFVDRQFRSGDVSFFSIRSEQPFDKYSALKRRQADLTYGRSLVDIMAEFDPDILVSANAPLDAQRLAFQWCKANGVRTVFWWQDILSLAIRAALGKRFPALGRMVAAYYERMERGLLAAADRVICISDDFHAKYRAWGLDPERAETIGNWGPLAEIDASRGRGEWRRTRGLVDHRIILYSGTLGLKHNPGVLLDLAENLAASSDMQDVRVVVVSEGRGAAWLAGEKAARAVDNLLILPFEPVEVFGDMLSSADVLLATLEEDAAEFCVPSKILSYLCAGRPIVMLAPPANYAARTIVRANAGIIVANGDLATFPDAVLDLLRDPGHAGALGRNGRAYAAASWSNEVMGERFAGVLKGILVPPGTPASAVLRPGRESAALGKGL